jgi:DNA-binding NarL/FixJ family response regulator
LPSNLDAAIKRLDDEELDRLFSAVVAEQKRRGKRLPNFAERTRRNEPSPSSLTRGQVNAVLAAFKAGVTPSRIARQFGLSQADVEEGVGI